MKCNFCERKAIYHSPVECCYMHYKRWWRNKSFDISWGKRSLSNSGYYRITVKGIRTFEHRFIMENYIGRKLTSKEIIHHINGIKTDNRIDNLMVISQSEHVKKYDAGRKRIINWNEYFVPEQKGKHIWNQNIHCLIKNCDRFAKTRYLCRKHYISFAKYKRDIIHLQRV